MWPFSIDLTVWLFPVLLLWAPAGLFAQDTGSRDRSMEQLMDHAYGPDQSLINGLQFYDRYLGVMGHPYLWEDRFREGSVTIGGMKHEGLELKYDLVEQEVVVKYTGGDGLINLVVTVPEHLEAFSVGPVLFRRLRINGTEGRFYQVVPTDHFDGYIHWEKKRVMINGNTRYREKCTDAAGHYLLWVDGEWRSYRNRRSFLRCFPVDWRREIRATLRSQNVQLGQASPEEMIRWLEAVSETIGKMDSLE